MPSILNAPEWLKAQQVPQQQNPYQMQAPTPMPAYSVNPAQQSAPVAAQGSDPFESAKKLAQQILGSQDATQAFNQMLASSPEAQKAMELINQYGNGDPKVALTNYAAAQGQQAVAQQIIQRMGLG